jgi:hypothetical protein
MNFYLIARIFKHLARAFKAIAKDAQTLCGVEQGDLRECAMKQKNGAFSENSYHKHSKAYVDSNSINTPEEAAGVLTKTVTPGNGVPS